MFGYYILARNRLQGSAFNLRGQHPLPRISTSRLPIKWLRNTRVQLVLGFAISGGLGWLAVRGIDWGLVLEQFQTFPIIWAFISLLTVVVANVLRAYRWRVLFVGEPVSLLRLFMVQNTGIGLNNVVPIRVVSEAVQFALLTLRYKVNNGVALGTMGIERVLDTVITASLLMAGLILIPDIAQARPYVIGAFVFAILFALAIPVFVKLAGMGFFSRISLLSATVEYLSQLKQTKSALVQSFLLTLAHWLLLGLAVWILAFGMDLGISPVVATLTILGTLYFTTSVPSLPAGLGTFEFAVVYVLKLFDVDQAAAFSFAVVIHAVVFLPPIVVAVALLSSLGMNPFKRTVKGAEIPTSPVPATSGSSGDE